MRLIIVKTFTKGNKERNTLPSMLVEVEGKEFNITNYGSYYSVSENNDRQVKIEDGVYDDVYSIIYRCLKDYLVEGKSYLIVEPGNMVREFFSDCKKFN